MDKTVVYLGIVEISPIVNIKIEILPSVDRPLFFWREG
jgi:hypothetical protein